MAKAPQKQDFLDPPISVEVVEGSNGGYRIHLEFEGGRRESVPAEIEHPFSAPQEVLRWVERNVNRKPERSNWRNIFKRAVKRLAKDAVDKEDKAKKKSAPKAAPPEDGEGEEAQPVPPQTPPPPPEEPQPKSPKPKDDQSDKQFGYDKSPPPGQQAKEKAAEKKKQESTMSRFDALASLTEDYMTEAEKKELSRKERKKLNKAMWKKMSPEEKKPFKGKKHKPMPTGQFAHDSRFDELAGLDEAKAPSFQKGDKVKYTGKWLRNTGQMTGSAGQDRGVIVDPNPSEMRGGFVKVQWKGRREPILVHGANLMRAGKPERAEWVEDEDSGESLFNRLVERRTPKPTSKQKAARKKREKEYDKPGYKVDPELSKIQKKAAKKSKFRMPDDYSESRFDALAGLDEDERVDPYGPSQFDRLIGLDEDEVLDEAQIKHDKLPNGARVSTVSLDFGMNKGKFETLVFPPGSMSEIDGGSGIDTEEEALAFHAKMVKKWKNRSLGEAVLDEGAYLEVTPAYGRDYKTKKEVQAAWDAGKDFIIQQFGHRYDGKPINKQDAEADRSIKAVNVRFAKMRKIHVINLR